MGIRRGRQDRAVNGAVKTVAEARERTGAAVGTLTKSAKKAQKQVGKKAAKATGAVVATGAASKAAGALAPKVEQAADWAGPKLEQARDWATPHVTATMEKVRDDLLPRIAEAVAAAIEASEPAREEAAVRSKGAVAVLKGQADAVPHKVKKHRGRKVLGLAAIAAAGAAGWKAWQSRQEQAAPWSDPHLASPSPSAGAGTSSVPSMATGATGTLAEEGLAGDLGAGDVSEDAAGASPDEALADTATTEAAAVEVSPETDATPVDGSEPGNEGGRA